MELKRRVLWIGKKFRMENQSHHRTVLKVEKPISVGNLHLVRKNTHEASFDTRLKKKGGVNFSSASVGADVSVEKLHSRGEPSLPWECRFSIPVAFSRK